MFSQCGADDWYSTETIQQLTMTTNNNRYYVLSILFSLQISKCILPIRHALPLPPFSFSFFLFLRFNSSVHWLSLVGLGLGIIRKPYVYMLHPVLMQDIAFGLGRGEREMTFSENFYVVNYIRNLGFRFCILSFSGCSLLLHVLSYPTLDAWLWQTIYAKDHPIYDHQSLSTSASA